MLLSVVVVFIAVVAAAAVATLCTVCSCFIGAALPGNLRVRRTPRRVGGEQGAAGHGYVLPEGIRGKGTR